MMKRVIGFLLIILLVSSSSVVGAGLKESAMDLSNPASLISVKRGETFSIILASNPTTGFAWQLAEALDSSLFAKQ